MNNIENNKNLNTSDNKEINKITKYYLNIINNLKLEISNLEVKNQEFKNNYDNIFNKNNELIDKSKIDLINDSE